jgi:DNA topoisomerase-1
LKSGVYLTCPNNKKPASADDKAGKRKKKVEEDTGVTCHYSKRLRDAPAAEVPVAPKAKRTTEEAAQPVA